jgi:hypothetical protein
MSCIALLLAQHALLHGRSPKPHLNLKLTALADMHVVWEWRKVAGLCTSCAFVEVGACAWCLYSAHGGC